MSLIEKYGREVVIFDTVVLSRASELHTGAEIEAAFVEALHRGFAQDQEPTELELGEVLCNSVPLATTMSEEIERLRHWSETQSPPRHARGQPRQQQTQARPILTCYAMKSDETHLPNIRLR